MQTQTQVRELMGMSVTDTNGTKVGTIKQVYLNDDSGAPEWVTVHTGWFGMRESFVPLSGARKSEDMLRVPYDKETIKGAPNVDADEHLSHGQIVNLYRHYGVRPPAGRSGGGGETDTSQGTAEDRPKAGGEAAAEDKAGAEGESAADLSGSQGRSGKPDDPGMAGAAGTAGMAGAAGMAVRPDRAKRDQGREGEREQAMPQQSPRTGAEAPMTEMTRSEERMRVDTERHESGRVRIHKWVETEMVERTVTVAHEEIKIDREPIKDGRPSPDVSIAEADREIILYEERPIMTKETVPVERVRVRTERVQDEQTVRGELRKERVEVTRDESPGTDRPSAERGQRGPGRGERGDPSS
ncbi:PRC and DUF2382 domain-containing protein [Actinomadura sp. 9N215]|uniref:PRC and DUF2382 domain-containing protein n=1 Tax=Actinomadura sp. 9N215 TaxID=3375150 RepID=UPI00379E1AC8